MRQDSWTNAINSYGMIHFIYKLNIFGGKRASSQNNDRQLCFLAVLGPRHF